MTFRTVIKEVAIEQGVYATFMPKPFTDQPGSGMHTHMSLFEGDANAFYDAAGHYQLSSIGRQFIAGLLRHAPEITAVTNHVRQLVPSASGGGDEAPGFITWGHNNRAALVRVPLYKPGQGPGRPRGIPRDRLRREPRTSPTRSCSPQASRASRRSTSSPPRPKPTRGSSPSRSGARSATPSSPSSLDQAVSLMEDSELVAETLGEQV